MADGDGGRTMVSQSCRLEARESSRMSGVCHWMDICVGQMSAVGGYSVDRG